MSRSEHNDASPTILDAKGLQSVVKRRGPASLFPPVELHYCAPCPYCAASLPETKKCEVIVNISKEKKVGISKFYDYLFVWSAPALSRFLTSVSTLQSPLRMSLLENEWNKLTLTWRTADELPDTVTLPQSSFIISYSAQLIASPRSQSSHHLETTKTQHFCEPIDPLSRHFVVRLLEGHLGSPEGGIGEESNKPNNIEKRGLS